jgi:hypothetical protein
LLIALPYTALIITVFFINYTQMYSLEKNLLISCTVFQVISLVCMSLYLYKVLGLKSPTDAAEDDIESSDRDVVVNPRFNTELSTIPGRPDDQVIVDSQKSYALGWYAVLFEVSVIMYLLGYLDHWLGADSQLS